MKKLLQRYRDLPVQVKVSFWFLICSFLQKGISLITTPIFTRLLTTEEYGQYNVFNSWYAIISIFVTLRLSGGVFVQGCVKFEEDRKIYISSFHGLSLSLFTVWTVIYLAFSDFWNNLFSFTTSQMLAMLLMSWLSEVFGFWSSEQRIDYKYKLLLCVTMITSIAKPLIGIVLVSVAEDKVTARIFGILLVEIVAYTWMFFAQTLRKGGRKLFSKKYWCYAIMFNLPLIPHYLSQTVLSGADRIMIQKMVGSSEAGIYSLSYSVSLIMLLFNNALMQTLDPWIYRKIKNRQIKNIAPIAYTTLGIIAGVNLMLITLAPEVIAVFAPASYVEAVYIIPPVAMSVYFMYMYDLFAKFAFYYEKTKFIMAASVIGAILNIVLNYVFIGLFGYQAAGYTTLFCYMLYSLCHYLVMTRICNKYFDGVKPYDVKKILGISAAFLVIGFAILFMYDFPAVRYGIIALAVILIIVKRKLIVAMVKGILSKKKEEN